MSVAWVPDLVREHVFELRNPLMRLLKWGLYRTFLSMIFRPLWGRLMSPINSAWVMCPSCPCTPLVYGLGLMRRFFSFEVWVYAPMSYSYQPFRFSWFDVCLAILSILTNKWLTATPPSWWSSRSRVSTPLTCEDPCPLASFSLYFVLHSCSVCPIPRHFFTFWQ